VVLQDKVWIVRWGSKKEPPNSWSYGGISQPHCGLPNSNRTPKETALRMSAGISSYCSSPGDEIILLLLKVGYYDSY
jgi:hypothetical protein